MVDNPARISPQRSYSDTIQNSLISISLDAAALDILDPGQLHSRCCRSVCSYSTSKHWMVKCTFSSIFISLTASSSPYFHSDIVAYCSRIVPAFRYVFRCSFCRNLIFGISTISQFNISTHSAILCTDIAFF